MGGFGMKPKKPEIVEAVKKGSSEFQKGGNPFPIDRGEGKRGARCDRVRSKLDGDKMKVKGGEKNVHL